MLKISFAQRGVTVTYETIRQWCQRFGPVYARWLRRRRGRLGDTWHLDEVFVTIHDVVQVLDWPVAATASQDSCLVHPAIAEPERRAWSVRSTT